VPVIFVKTLFMKKLFFIASLFVFLQSCKTCSNSSILNGSVDNYGQNSTSKFKYLGTLALASPKNKAVLFSEMFKTAKDTYGNKGTIANIRKQVVYRTFLGLKAGLFEQVIFDVYEGQ
jgi:hypothetical protein